MKPDKVALALSAVAKAAEVRDVYGIPAHHGVNVFDFCTDLFKPNVKVRFVDISMEGLYLHKEREIWLGLRPLTRRVFTCAHELGHCIFRHGSTLDELQSEAATDSAFQPNEFLVNTFAAHFLMPRIAVCAAYSSRGWKPRNSTPSECFIVANSLGVGYETLATQLVYGLGLISGSAAQRLLDTTVPVVRKELLGHSMPNRLQVIDTAFTTSAVDTEVGTMLLLPSGATAENANLQSVSQLECGKLFQACHTGITRVTAANGWAILVRTTRKNYVGSSRFRHLEAAEGDDE